MYCCRQAMVDGIEVVELTDAARDMRVSIAPRVGNIAYEYLVNGKNILWFPFSGLGELKDHQALCGIPFLAPWANRIDGDSYWVNGREFRLDLASDLLRLDAHRRAIHGLLLFSSEWTLESVVADQNSARIKSVLRFWKHPELMAQFPFAHEIAVTYKLADGSLEVETAIHNRSAEPLPVAIGFHPYFRLHDTPQSDWTVHLAARDRLVLDDFLIPTGERQPTNVVHRLCEGPIDAVFTNLIREDDGAARFRVEGERESITVTYGPRYPVAIVYAPPGQEFLCFEPMAAITNAFNLSHRGLYSELQSIPPGGQWRESFWITPAGF